MVRNIILLQRWTAHFDFKFGLQFSHFLVCNVEMGSTGLIYYLLVSSWWGFFVCFVFHHGLNASAMLKPERKICYLIVQSNKCYDWESLVPSDLIK